MPGRPHWWQWLTVLSFDAPLVALAWQSALAHGAGVTLHAHHRVILGAAVWLVYAADRWIEGWRLETGQIRTQRHLFYHRWRWPVAVIWSAVAVAALGLAVARLTRAEFISGLLLLVPVLVYLLSHQLAHRHLPWRAPKEICVALLFAAGVMLFPWAADHHILRGIALPLVLFGLLCLANCALISLWEGEVDRTHGQTSLALQFPEGAPLVHALPWVIAVLAAGATLRANASLAPALSCAAASGALLGAVDGAHRRIGRQLARVLVDVALMTPWVPLAWAWLRAR